MGVVQTERPAAVAGEMTHREVLEALAGLLLGLFVAILSSTVVANALPTIIAELHASQITYTWVITAALLATTVSTPVWGKLADLVSKKTLVQISLVVYMLGSLVAGLAQDSAMLIFARVVQGIGAGGLTALTQVIIATMIAPRDRGRYSGYIGATFALATIGGPLIGGAIVDTSWLGWRWCFLVGAPFAAAALVVLQKTLHLPVNRRKVKVDVAGATLITASVSLLLIWVSFAGDQFAWLSWQTWAMVGGALVLGTAFLLAERRAAEPIVPLHLLRLRTVSLSVLASMMVGIAMFGSTTFLSQYFQLARGDSPTMAGVLTLPMILGLAVASTAAGRRITATGRWRKILVAGAEESADGLALLATMRADTPYWQLALYMVPLGAGLGMTMQNLVLAVQNQVAMAELGAASALVAFGRTLGGAVGVSALGAVLAHRFTDYLADGLAALGITPSGGGHDALPKVSTLPQPVRGVFEESFGHSIAEVFLIASIPAAIALVAILFVREVPLRRSNDEAVTPS
ncbi:hypothetical protein GCM10027589_32180 [Actinocorallia lasiicapitis]